MSPLAVLLALLPTLVPTGIAAAVLALVARARPALAGLGGGVIVAVASIVIARVVIGAAFAFPPTDVADWMPWWSLAVGIAAAVAAIGAALAVVAILVAVGALLALLIARLGAAERAVVAGAIAVALPALTWGWRRLAATLPPGLALITGTVAGASASIALSLNGSLTYAERLSVVPAMTAGAAFIALIRPLEPRATAALLAVAALVVGGWLALGHFSVGLPLWIAASMLASAPAALAVAPFAAPGWRRWAAALAAQALVLAPALITSAIAFARAGGDDY